MEAVALLTMALTPAAALFLRERFKLEFESDAIADEESLDSHLEFQNHPSPKIVALKKGLLSNRASVSKAPVGVISLNLPISVLTSESSIDVKGGLDKENGTYLLIIELTAFETAYAVEKKPIKNEEI
jgi:hypothetical protein